MSNYIYSILTLEICSFYTIYCLFSFSFPLIKSINIYGGYIMKMYNSEEALNYFISLLSDQEIEALGVIAQSMASKQTLNLKIENSEAQIEKLENQIEKLEAKIKDLTANIKENEPLIKKMAGDNPLKYPELFSRKTFFSSSSFENTVYNYLLNSITDDYVIIPHTSLVDLFSYDNDTTEYNIYKFLGYHVDFTIFDSIYYPVLSIEVNGILHQYNYQREIDNKKKKLFDYFKIPLITIDIPEECSNEEAIVILNQKLSDILPIVYCWRCKTPIEYSKNSSEKMITCPTCGKTNIPIKPLFLNQF